MIYLLLALVLLAAVILAAPVSLGYDSSVNGIEVRWLGLTFTSGPGTKKPKKSSKKDIGEKKARNSAILGLLWPRRDLIRDLLGQILGLAGAVWRTLIFRDSVATFSLPDPMWNGIFSALIRNFQVRNLQLSVNFEERNYAKIRVIIHPYRVLLQLAVFLCRLPYPRLLRLAWDLQKARQSG